jgi:hypothetical protein
MLKYSFGSPSLKTLIDSLHEEENNVYNLQIKLEDVNGEKVFLESQITHTNLQIKFLEEAVVRKYDQLRENLEVDTIEGK